MADSKISALTNYTAPITTDVLPIVDITNSITKKIPISALDTRYAGPYLNDYFLPLGWNAGWIRAKANQGTTPAWILGIGDSIMNGGVASNWPVNSWWSLLRTWITGTYTLYADFYPIMMSADYITSRSGTFNGTPPFVVNSTTGRSYGTSRGYGVVIYWNSVVMPVITFTTPYACTSMDIIHIDGFTGTWQYSVDGGGNQTITNSAASSQRRISLTSLANTTHTITMGLASTGAAAVLLAQGVATYKNTTGIGFAQLAAYGNSLNDTWAGNNGPADQAAQLMGKTDTLTTGFGFPMQPDLLILGHCIQDTGGQLTQAVFMGNFQRMILAARRVKTDCSIIFLIPSDPSGNYSEVTSGNFGWPLTYGQYKSYLYSLAQTYNCAVVDIDTRWGNTGVSQGFQTASEPHPNDAGHADIATALKAIL